MDEKGKRTVIAAAFAVDTANDATITYCAAAFAATAATAATAANATMKIRSLRMARQNGQASKVGRSRRESSFWQVRMN